LYSGWENGRDCNRKSAILTTVRSEARCEGNGPSLDKHQNAAAGHHGNALWVGLSVPMDCVPPLAKGGTIAREERLAMNTDKPTEPVNTTLLEY